MLLKNQKGQFVLEAVLLMTLSLSLMLVAVKAMREGNFLASLVESPWDRTAGMIESGVWTPASQAKSKVPYQLNRFYTPEVK